MILWYFKDEMRARNKVVLNGVACKKDNLGYFLKIQENSMFQKGASGQF